MKQPALVVFNARKYWGNGGAIMLVATGTHPGFAITSGQRRNQGVARGIQDSMNRHKLERERIERLNRPQQVFNDALKDDPDSDLFDKHELKTSKPYNTVGAAIAQALKSGQPAFHITGITSPEPETYQIEAIYEIRRFSGRGNNERPAAVHHCLWTDEG